MNYPNRTTKIVLPSFVEISEPVLILKWKARKGDTTNGGYTHDWLQNYFNKVGYSMFFLIMSIPFICLLTEKSDACSLNAISVRKRHYRGGFERETRKWLNRIRRSSKCCEYSSIHAVSSPSAGSA